MNPLFRFLRRAFALGVTLAAWKVGAAEPVRVVSQTVGTDELLLALAEPGQIAALSHLSREPAFCAVTEQAKAYPQLNRHGDVEGILKFHPTLVLCADYTRSEVVTQLRRTGSRVLIIERYHTLPDAFANLRLLARELGPAAEARAERIVAEGEARVRTLRERLRGVKLVRVLAPSTYGMIPGYDSTFQDLCDHAAADNLAASIGKLRGHAASPNEQLLAWPIDRVVVGGTDLESALAPYRRLTPYQFMAAVREGRAVLLKPWMLSCVTHHRLDGYEQLARALHPEAFR
jgi:iron complex transport system substrate-binding protein